MVQQRTVRKTEREQEAQAAPVGDPRVGRRAAPAQRAPLHREADAEQKGEDRQELRRNEGGDHQVDRRVERTRRLAEEAERIAGAPDERLDVDLQDAGEREGPQRVDGLDARAAQLGGAGTDFPPTVVAAPKPAASR